MPISRKRLNGAEAEDTGWRVEELCAQPGSAAALAAEGQDSQLVCYPQTKAKAVSY